MAPPRDDGIPGGALAALGSLPGWELVATGDGPAPSGPDDTAGRGIEKTFELPDFATAIELVVRVGFAAEAADHHPDLDVRWRRVRVLLTSHDAGGLTARDVSLATEVDGFAARLGATRAS